MMTTNMTIITDRNEVARYIATGEDVYFLFTNQEDGSPCLGNAQNISGQYLFDHLDKVANGDEVAVLIRRNY